MFIVQIKPAYQKMYNFFLLFLLFKTYNIKYSCYKNKSKNRFNLCLTHYVFIMYGRICVNVFLYDIYKKKIMLNT